MKQEIIPPNKKDDLLAGHAETIRALGKRVIKDVIEIGRRLTACKKLLAHGEWLPWLKDEFKWSDATANKFMRVSKMMSDYKSQETCDLDVPVEGLYLLSRPSTPEAARDEVIEEAEDGKKLSLEEVKKIIEKAKADEACAAEKRFEKLRKEFDKREAELRDEYEDRLTEEQVKKTIEKVLGPLQKKLNAAEKQLSDIKKEQEKPDKPSPVEKKLAEFDGKAVAISNSLEWFVKNVVEIKPERMIEYHNFIAKATDQTPQQEWAKDAKNAKRALGWLSKYVELLEENDEGDDDDE